MTKVSDITLYLCMLLVTIGGIGVILLIAGGVLAARDPETYVNVRECTVLNASCTHLAVFTHFQWGVLTHDEAGFVDITISTMNASACLDTSHPVGSVAPCWRYPGERPAYDWKKHRNGSGILMAFGAVLTSLPLTGCCLLVIIRMSSDRKQFDMV
jgi:hypothetical protein